MTIPPQLAGIPFTDAVNQEFLGEPIMESNAYAALDAGLTLPTIRTFARPNDPRCGFQWEIVDPRANFVQAYPELKATGSRKPWTRAVPGERYLTRQLRNLDRLKVDLQYEMKATGSCNVAFDMWLLKDRDGGPESIAAEVMVWLESQGNLRPAGTEIENCLWMSPGFGDGPAWPYFAFATAAATPFDLGASLAELVRRGSITDDLWLSTVEIGCEIVDGAGWIVFDRFEVEIG